jgi:hypothetical protein
MALDTPRGVGFWPSRNIGFRRYFPDGERRCRRRRAGRIGDVIIRLRDAGITVLLVEHKLPFAHRVASDVRISG